MKVLGIDVIGLTSAMLRLAVADDHLDVATATLRTAAFHLTKFPTLLCSAQKRYCFIHEELQSQAHSALAASIAADDERHKLAELNLKVFVAHEIMHRNFHDGTRICCNSSSHICFVGCACNCPRAGGLLLRPQSCDLGW